MGCVSNYLFPRVAQAALDLFLGNGISVYIPKEQHCCGLPAFGSGDEETPRSLARKNIESFAEENLDQIVAHCASCAAMLKLDYPLLFGEDDPFRAKALAFSEKVSDASRFLAQIPDLKRKGSSRGKKSCGLPTMIPVTCAASWASSRNPGTF